MNEGEIVQVGTICFPMIHRLQSTKISPVGGLTIDSSQLTFLPTSKSRDT